MALVGIPGGRAPERIGSVSVTSVIEGDERAAVDARVVEEDRYLLLSARAQVSEEKNRLRTMTNGFGAEPVELGTLVLRQGRPLTMLAVVIDVDADPPVEEVHVRRAYERVLAVCVAQRLACVRVPLLGRHGRLPPERSAALLREVLDAHEADFPRELFVVLRDDESL